MRVYYGLEDQQGCQTMTSEKENYCPLLIASLSCRTLQRHIVGIESNGGS